MNKNKYKIVIDFDNKTSLTYILLNELGLSEFVNSLFNSGRQNIICIYTYDGYRFINFDNVTNMTIKLITEEENADNK